jgi:hypothetical protein
MRQLPEDASEEGQGLSSEIHRRNIKILVPESFVRGSVFSEDRQYRYSLFRRWGNGPTVLFIGLNPSIADDTRDDPTQLRMRKAAQDWGYGGYCVGNLFALVSTDPKELLRAKDPVGPRNDETLLTLHRNSSRTIAAWGCQGDMVHRRALKVLYNLRDVGPFYAMATCADGCPRHPLYLRSGLEPIPFRRDIAPSGVRGEDDG